MAPGLSGYVASHLSWVLNWKNSHFPSASSGLPPLIFCLKPSGPGGRGGPRGSPQRRWRPLHSAYAWYAHRPPPFPRVLPVACKYKLEIDFCVCAVNFWIFLPPRLAICRLDSEKIDIERPFTGGFSIAGRRQLRRASRAERFAHERLRRRSRAGARSWPSCRLDCCKYGDS